MPRGAHPPGIYPHTLGLLEGSPGLGGPIAQGDASSVANASRRRPSRDGQVGQGDTERFPTRAQEQRASLPRHWGQSTPRAPCPPWLTRECSASEQRLLGRDPVAPGKRSGHGPRLAQHAVLETLVNDLGRLQAELAQRLRRPPDVLDPSSRSEREAPRPASHPPTLRRGAAHSATHGRASEGAGRAPHQSLPSGPAHARTPRLAPPAPGHGPRGPGAPTARRRKAARRPLASSSATETSGHSVATTRPGSPPPAPRSTNGAGPGRRTVDGRWQ